MTYQNLQSGEALQSFYFPGRSFPDTLLLFNRLYIHLFNKETIFGNWICFFTCCLLCGCIQDRKLGVDLI